MDPVEFATLNDVSRIAEMTGLSLSDVTSAIEGDASAQNSVGYALLESSDIELGLAFLAASAQQGVPWALGSYTWFCLKTEQFERARDLFATSAHACEMFVAVNSDDYESFEFLQTEWVNCRNNEALCALAMNEDPSWALAVWAEGADTGHPESNFYPALVDWKLGEEQRAIEHLEGLDSDLLDEMRQIMTDGSSSAVGWFSLWCDEGIALLDRYESSNLSLPPAPPAGDRFCTQCGAERQVEHKFCGGCGAKFSGLDQAVANFVSDHDFANDPRSQRLGTGLCPHLGPWITDVTATISSAEQFAELASRIQDEPSDPAKASLVALHRADLPAGWAEVLTWAVKADPAGEFVLIAIGALYGLVEERLYGSDTSSPSDVKSLVYLVEGVAGFEYAYIEASNSQNYIPLGDADIWWPDYMSVVNTSLTHADLREISDTLGDACDTEMLSILTPGDRLAELSSTYPHSSVVAANANLPSNIVNERMKDDWALLFHPNANKDRSWEIIQGILSDGSYEDLGYYMYEFSNLRDDNWFALSGFASTSPQALWLKERMKQWIEANIDDEYEQAEMFEMLGIGEE